MRLSNGTCTLCIAHSITVSIECSTLLIHSLLRRLNKYRNKIIKPTKQQWHVPNKPHVNQLVERPLASSLRRKLPVRAHPLPVASRSLTVTVREPWYVFEINNNKQQLCMELLLLYPFLFLLLPISPFLFSYSFSPPLFCIMRIIVLVWCVHHARPYARFGNIKNRRIS